MIKQVRPRDELIEKLEFYLQFQHLLAGQRLPSERDLCELWNVNRSTLRSALKILEKKGLIYSEPGKGYFKKKGKLLRNLQSMHSLIETAQDQGFKLQTRVLKSSVIDCDTYLSSRLIIEKGHPVFELIRLRYLDDIPAMIEYSYLNTEYCCGIETVDFKRNSLYKTLEKRCSLNPKQGKQKISVTKLTKSEAKLLDSEVGSSAIFLNGNTFDSKDLDHPIEFFKSIIRTDLVEFSSTLKVIKVKEN